MFKLMKEGTDLSPYTVKMNWQGSLEQAGRRIDFTMAYTKKDNAWPNQDIALGDTVELDKVDDATGKITKLFIGKVFMQSRASESYTMDYVAYDSMIYLTKSHMTAKYDNATIRDVIKNVCTTLSVEAGKLESKDLDAKVSFVADDMAGTDIIKKALETAYANSKYTYHIYMAIEPDTGKNTLEVVRADTVIENYTATDTVDIETAKHSSSIEDMVNQVAVVDDSGNVTGYIKNADDIQKYGLLQAVYKFDEKQNTEQSARLLLHKVSEHSELKAIGNIQCIAGYAIAIQEEQINGIFLISSDQHEFSDNEHHMTLTLTYLEKPNDAKDATTEGNVNPTSTKGKTGTGVVSNVSAGIKAGYEAWAGATMDNGTNGCVEAVGKIGSWYSPFLKQENENGVVSVPKLVSDAGSNVIPFDSTKLEAGDTIVYGDNDHVVIAAGPSGDYVGNSSSQNMVIRGSDYTQMGGLYPTKIIKTSHM